MLPSSCKPCPQAEVQDDGDAGVRAAISGVPLPERPWPLASLASPAFGLPLPAFAPPGATGLAAAPAVFLSENVASSRPVGGGGAGARPKNALCWLLRGPRDGVVAVSLAEVVQPGNPLRVSDAAQR